MDVNNPLYDYIMGFTTYSLMTDNKGFMAVNLQFLFKAFGIDIKINNITY